MIVNIKEWIINNNKLRNLCSKEMISSKKKEISQNGNVYELYK